MAKPGRLMDSAEWANRRRERRRQRRREGWNRDGPLPVIGYRRRWPPKKRTSIARVAAYDRAWPPKHRKKRRS